MLKCGYRNIDAKNEHGQTAVHLACKNKNVSPEILKQLIERGANVNSRDTKGNTPLHVSRKFGV
jgi:tyrosine-protein kinase